MPEANSTKPPTTLRPQDGKVEQVDADPTAAVSALCLFSQLAGERLVPLWQRFFFDNELEFSAHFPANLSTAYAISRREAPAFVLAHLAHPTDIGGHLSSVVPVASVYFPPLIVLLDWAASAAEREELRIQGASLILDGVDPSHADPSSVLTIASSHSWFRGSTERLSLVDLLQMFAQDRKSGLVTVACPHMRDISTRPWRESRPCNGDKSARCEGWYGRLYVTDGALTHIETPNAGGIAALAQLLELRSGTIRIHDMFLEPANRNGNGSIQNNIMDAMVLADELRRAQPPPPPPPRPAPPRPAPPRPSSSRHAPPSVPSSAGGVRDSHPDAALTYADTDILITETIDEVPTRDDPTTTTPITPTGSPQMNTLGPILTLTTGLSAAAKAGADGNVQEVAGQVDGESLCAVAAMCGPPLQRVAGLLAMGDLGSWAHVNKKRTIYTVRTDDGIVVVTGDPTKNPDSTTKKIVGAVGSKKR